ncbi:anti-sigma factor [Ornithinimicrobium cryptoxanthini]|uniref:Anti-sigma factor n=1 Tax=Ornithinimicrobium cryptoxanthini TaxID=2934161 RepID=A0ABY4YDB7_9MICO|nr:anti-sigma factor [Ornithinimicrobium cryptoxanthini]USQ74758.1 anti-sigma factor [Ornithinimicrobium cryptoxanthini]
MNQHGTGPEQPPGSQGSATDAQTVELLRRGGVVEHPPPAHVWPSIVEALGSSLNSARQSRGTTGVGARDLAHARHARSGGRAGSWAGSGVRLLAAAAVGAVVAWTGVALTDRDQAAEVLASGELVPLADGGTGGSAQVVEVDGHQRLRVQLSAAPDAADGYLEVWLLRPDVSGMVTLGVLDGDEGEFLLPGGIDLAEFAVVDISREHMDGDPGHGGDSLVRGEVG